MILSDREILDARILIVDDQQANVDLLEQILSKAGYTSVLGITDPTEAVPLYQAFTPDLVLLDINMPQMNGFDVMAGLNEIEQESYTPVLVLTALQDEETRLRSLQSGAQDFLTKPFNNLEVITRINNMLKIRLLHKRVAQHNVTLEHTVQERTKELYETRLEIVNRLGQAAEYRDNETGNHIIRMSKMCERLGVLTGMNKAQADLLLHSSPMHDVGKIGIPDAILLKPGKLTADEWSKMKDHTVIGAKLLEGHGSDLVTMARSIALSHHEKWDGSGYPLSLKGEDIPLVSRIAAIADVFDALTSARPYKEPYPIGKALEIIKDGRGSHFDPVLIDLFMGNLDDFLEIKESLLDEAQQNVTEVNWSQRDLDEGRNKK